MNRAFRIRGLFPVAVACAVAVAGAASAGERKPEGSGIVAPSEYVEDIETPGDSGGVMDEVDAGEAQAEAAERAAKEKADEKKRAADDEGGW